MGKKENKNPVEQESAEMGKQLETMNVKIKEINENPEKKISPVIGYFPSGFDPLKNSEESNSKYGVSSVKVYKNAKRNPKNPRLEVVVGVGGSAVNFVGTSYSGEARTPQLCNYALGVLDKETGVLKMVPIATNKIFRLEPKVPGVEQPENESRDAEKEADAYEERESWSGEGLADCVCVWEREEPRRRRQARRCRRWCTGARRRWVVGEGERRSRD